MSAKPLLARRHGVALWWVALLALISPCAGVSSHGDTQQPTVDLAVRASVEGTASVAPRVGSMKADGVVLTGVMAAPNPCYEIRASLESDGRSLTLRLSAVASGGFCIQTLAAFAYDATISGMTAGSYPIDVVYTYPNTGWEERSYTLRVTVP